MWGVLHETVGNAVLAYRGPEKYLPRVSTEQFGNGYALGPFWKTGASSPHEALARASKTLQLSLPGPAEGGQAEVVAPRQRVSRAGERTGPERPTVKKR